MAGEMQWKPEFNTGVPWIDDQHKIFLGLINGLIRFEREAEHPVSLERLLMEIEAYARFHFVSEENLMIRTGYPKLDEQQHQHAQLLEDLDRRIRAAHEGTGDQEIAVKVHIQLLNWLLTHTVESDMDIGVFLREKCLA